MTKTGEAARPAIDENTDSLTEWLQAHVRHVGIGAIVVAAAAAEYLKASETTQLQSERESLKADAARAYVAAGKSDEALKLWRAMADDEASSLNAEAKLRVGELSAAVAAK